MDNTPENIKKLRAKLGITQSECGKIFGVGLRTWQKKEEAKTHNRLNLSKVEFEYLLLLAGEHPDYVLCRRKKIESNEKIFVPIINSEINDGH